MPPVVPAKASEALCGWKATHWAKPDTCTALTEAVASEGAGSSEVAREVRPRCTSQNLTELSKLQEGRRDWHTRGEHAKRRKRAEGGW